MYAFLRGDFSICIYNIYVIYVYNIYIYNICGNLGPDIHREETSYVPMGMYGMHLSKTAIL